MIDNVGWVNYTALPFFMLFDPGRHVLLVAPVGRELAGQRQAVLHQLLSEQKTTI